MSADQLAAALSQLDSAVLRAALAQVSPAAIAG